MNRNSGAGPPGLWLKRYPVSWRHIAAARLPVLIVLDVGALVLGFIGLEKTGVYTGFLNILYADLQLIFLEFNVPESDISWQLQAARFLVPPLALAVTVQAIIAVLDTGVEQFRLHWLTHHAVVCGMGYMGERLVHTLQDQGWKVLVIDNDEANPVLRRHREQGGLVVIGDARSAETLRHARVHRAVHVVVVCGNDAVNAEVAVQARLLAESAGGQIKCLVHLSDAWLCRLVRLEELGAPLERGSTLEFFDVFERGARALLKDYPPFDAARVEAGETFRVVFVGSGSILDGLLVECARAWRSSWPNIKQRFLAVIVGPGAAAAAESMSQRYPFLSKACELRTHETALHSAAIDTSDFLSASGAESLGAIYVGLDEGAHGFAVALAMASRLSGQDDVPVVAAMTDSAGLGSLVDDGERPDTRFAHLHAFRLLERTLADIVFINEMYETIAQSIHRRYIRLQEEQGETPSSNASMVPWEKLSRELKQSSRLQALHIPTKLTAIGCSMIRHGEKRDLPSYQFSADDVELMARMEHDRWMSEKFMDDWEYGPVKFGKQNPNLVDWALLEATVADWDRAFCADIPEFLTEVKYRIVREGELEDRRRVCPGRP